MPAGQLQHVIRQLRRAAQRGHEDEPADAELLEHYIARRDAGAFEAILRRHGPMVLGVCRRILRHEADAEDAFQATFVVFVRKATAILPRSKLGNWLYGVAHRTALKARAMSRKRHAREQAARAGAQSVVRDEPRALLLDRLDDELSVLPEKYRTAIVLCDLEGLSYREAAARLGCPQGTLSGRLTRARALLAHRLARHGPALTAGSLAALLARNALASVPPSLMTSTTRAGALLITGRAITTGAVSARVAFIAEGVLKMMLLTRLKLVTGLILGVAAVVAAGWTGAAPAAARAPVSGNVVPTGCDTEPARSSADGAAARGIDAGEAEFVFLTADPGGKAVSLLVAGTSAPVLKLPVRGDVCVLVRGKSIGVADLRAGARVALRMDATNRVIQEIRALEEARGAAHVLLAQDLQPFPPPSSQEVLRALPRGTPIYEVVRDNIQIVTERLTTRTERLRFFPLVGPARLCHCHWKCTVHCTETVTSDYPFPFRSQRPCVEVVYIDKNYLIPGE